MANNAHRNVSVDITGDSSDLERSYGKAMKKTKDFDDALDKSTANAKKQNKALADDADTQATSAVGKMAKIRGETTLIMAAIVAGMIALGPASVLAAGLITLAFGGAIATMGIMAAKGNAQVAGEFSEMWDDITDRMRDSAEPIRTSLMHIPDIFRDVFSQFAPELERSFAALGPAITMFVKDFGEGFTALLPSIEPLTQGVIALLDAIGKDSPEMFGHLGAALTTFSETATKHADDFAAALTAIMGILNGLASAIDYVAGEWDLAMTKLELILAGISGGSWQVDLDNSMTSMNRAVDGVKNAIVEYGKIAEVWDDAAVSADRLTVEMKELTGVHYEADLAAMKYADELDVLNGYLKEASGGLDINTSAGLSNQKQLLKVVDASRDLLAARAEEGATTRELNGLLTVHRDQLYNAAMQLLNNEGAARRLVERYMAFPKSLHTSIHADTSGAQNAVDNFIYTNSGRRIPIDVYNRNAQLKDGGLVGYASGGRVSGPGGSRSDRVPIMASRGEFVMNASATRRHLPMLESINAGRGVEGMGTTVIYQINTTVAPTANLAAVGGEIVKSIQAFEKRSSKTWRAN